MSKINTKLNIFRPFLHFGSLFKPNMHCFCFISNWIVNGLKNEWKIVVVFWNPVKVIGKVILTNRSLLFDIKNFPLFIEPPNLLFPPFQIEASGIQSSFNLALFNKGTRIIAWWNSHQIVNIFYVIAHFVWSRQFIVGPHKLLWNCSFSFFKPILWFRIFIVLCANGVFAKVKISFNLTMNFDFSPFLLLLRVMLEQVNEASIHFDDNILKCMKIMLFLSYQHL